MLESPCLPLTAGYIDGAWCPAESGKTFEVRNPANGDLLAEVPAMGKGETERAVAAAVRAQESPIRIHERGDWLRRIATILVAQKDELGRIVTLENGKPLAEARAEVDAAGFYRYAADHVDELRPRRLAERPRDHEWTVHHRPAGVAALITPWNFPQAMIAKKLSAAIAADCAVVIKPPSQTPLSMIALFSVLEEAGLPAGRANLVMGRSGPIGEVLTGHPEVRVISFTGSTEVGRKLLEAAAPQVKRVSMELGGNAPFLVFEDADLESAAAHLMQNKLRANGQTCVCTNRVLVHRSIADRFSALLAEKVGALRVGDGMEEGVDVGPLIDRDGFDKVRRHVEDALAHGATLVAGGSPPEPPESGYGCFFPPTVIRGVPAGAACLREETFGPLFALTDFESEGDAVRAANETIHGLAAYVFTADDGRAGRVIGRLQFGHVGHNTGTGPAPEAPFGGMKQSGIGREGGIEGLLEFVETQTVPHKGP